VHTFIGGPPTETKKIGVCQNEHRPRDREQKYVTAIHRRKLVKNCLGGAVECRRHSNEGAEERGVKKITAQAVGGP